MRSLEKASQCQAFFLDEEEERCLLDGEGRLVFGEGTGGEIERFLSRLRKWWVAGSSHCLARGETM